MKRRPFAGGPREGSKTMRQPSQTAEGRQTGERRQTVHSRIEQFLRDQISAGKFAEGDQLPPEVEIAESFSVSRQTVRTAILKLAADGIVERFPGRGTFVTDARQATRPWAVTSLNDVLERGFTGDIETLSISVVLAVTVPEAAISLQVLPEERLLQVETLRRQNGRVTAHAVTHVPDRLAAGLPEDLAAAIVERRLLSLVEEANDMVASKMLHTSGAKLADDRMAEVLGVAPGSALLTLRNIYYDADERPMETSVVSCASTGHRMTIELHRMD